MTIKVYIVGGYVRDQILGVESKDIDYAVEAPSYTAMVEWIKERGKIFLEKPEFLTVRAHMEGKQPADFVLCRKDGTYTDGRRPDSVVPGTIHDDLARRDFTMNALAMDEDGYVLDPFFGAVHLKDKRLVCVGNAKDRFGEDALRMLRAIRFGITKGLDIDSDIAQALRDPELLTKLKENVSVDRKREELSKAFAFDTRRTLRVLDYYDGICRACFEDSPLWLMPTSKSG